MALYLQYTFNLDDGSTLVKTLPISNQMDQWSVQFTCVTLDQLKSLDASLQTKLVVSYSVAVLQETTVIVGPYEYEVDYRSYYNTYTLFYRTSLGALESIVLRGQVDFQSDYDRQTATRTVPPSYYSNLNLLPQSVDENTMETTSLTGDTSWMTQPELEKLRDLFLSPQKFEMLNGRLIPIVLTANNAKWYTNKDSLYSVQIQWSRAFSNLYFTPEGFITVNPACPPMESLAAKQVNQNLLQIMYALPAPYERVQVTVSDGTNVATYTYTGNTGSVLQSYNLTGVTQLTITAQVLCDESSNPVSAGPVSSITLAITQNLAPIANDDTYNISSGYNSAITLSGSVLANDYDPDNGTISVVPASGATNAGGTFSINAAGAVQYQPPTSVYKGQDFFDYTIIDDQNSTAVARVYINVGAAKLVYARLKVDSTTTQWYSGYGQPFEMKTTTTGTVYLQFFADAAATIPVDVTSYGIVANVQLTQNNQAFFQNPTSAQSTLHVACSSFTTTIFEGQLYYKHYKTFIVGTGYNQTEYEQQQRLYALQPGTGYTPL